MHKKKYNLIYTSFTCDNKIALENEPKLQTRNDRATHGFILNPLRTTGPESKSPVWSSQQATIVPQFIFSSIWQVMSSMFF